MQILIYKTLVLCKNIQLRFFCRINDMFCAILVLFAELIKFCSVIAISNIMVWMHTEVIHKDEVGFLIFKFLNRKVKRQGKCLPMLMVKSINKAILRQTYVFVKPSIFLCWQQMFGHCVCLTSNAVIHKIKYTYFRMYSQVITFVVFALL